MRLPECITALRWTKELSVGNGIIDSEHRNLIGMVNDVVHAIGMRDCGALEQAFGLLEDWLCVHFSNEAKIAQAINLDLSGRGPAQYHSLLELRRMRDELLAGNGIWPGGARDHFARSLKGWMIDGHIIDSDMPMKPALQARDYRFCPCW